MSISSFERIFGEIGNHVRALLVLPHDKLNRLSLQREIEATGEQPLFTGCSGDI